MGLRDRFVLITGGGGGAGPTIGRAFAAEGAFVAVHHRTGSPSAARAEAAAAGIVAAGGRAIAVNADLRSTAEASAMIERIEAELGAVAVLVTATSGYASGRFAEISDESVVRKDPRDTTRESAHRRLPDCRGVGARRRRHGACADAAA